MTNVLDERLVRWQGSDEELGSKPDAKCRIPEEVGVPLGENEVGVGAYKERKGESAVCSCDDFG